MRSITALLERAYWSLPRAWRLFPMLILDACFAMGVGTEAVYGRTWPPALWAPEASNVLVLRVVGVYMLVGAVGLVIGLTAYLSTCCIRHRGKAWRVMLGGVWLMWSAYAVSLAMSVYEILGAGGAREWGPVALWTAETFFLSLVLAAIYWDPAYKRFTRRPLPDEHEGCI